MEIERKGLRVGGVPENVNIAWYEALKDDAGTYSWRDCPGGTGEMCRLLEADELDVALVLTEGAISHIAKGSQLRIAGTYVNSPLSWGVHCLPDANDADIRRARFAVSRMGSGSHLMSFVYASQKGWLDTRSPEIVVCGGLNGALEAFKKGEVDYFLWEKFMTKPLVDKGVLARHDICKGPWPAFSFAIRPEVEEGEIKSLIKKIRTKIDQIDRQSYVEKVVNRFGLQKSDVEEWFDETQFSCKPEVDIAALEGCSQFLFKVGVLNKAYDPRLALVDFLTCEMSSDV